MKLTKEQIEAGKTEKGGFTRKQLEAWGVPYPPPKGWQEALMNGQTMEEAGLEAIQWSPIRNQMNAHELLRKVVLAVVDAGHASDLYGFPDVLEYFGARIPDQDELFGHHKPTYNTADDDKHDMGDMR